MDSARTLTRSQKKNAEIIKLLVFSVGTINVALSIDIVQKVINYATIVGSGLNYYGLVNIENQEITVIDLHQKLFNAPQTLNPEDKKYLLLVQNTGGETFGLVVKNSPELCDISTNMVRVLPQSYRRADTLKIASHVFMLEQNETEEGKTVFILDPDELIAPQ